MKVGDKVRFSLKARRQLCRNAGGIAIFAPHIHDEAIIVRDMTFSSDYEGLTWLVEAHNGIWHLRWSDGEEANRFGDDLRVVKE
jgi:hypothetical protein